MKIQAINNFNFYKNSFKNNRIEDNVLNNTPQNTVYRGFPTAQHYLSYINFTGGYSEDLAETIKSLDSKYYPPDIKEMAQNVVDNGNPDGLRLIDIHRQKYGKINEMESLDEVKEEFPEFRDVLSDREISYEANSFIDDVKNDKLEYFDPEVDLALQLLQMYWADGFSLNDLKNYTNGKNIYSAFVALNIQRQTPLYGSILQKSDKEYEKRLTETIPEKRREFAKLKAEKKAGAHITRRPRTEQEREDNSQRLIQYYIDHPEKAASASKRMREYYAKHPELREQRRRVTTVAWNLPEAKSVRKKLSKFMGKKDINAEEFVTMTEEEPSKGQKSRLALFWEKNAWAAPQWSKCMKKAWAKVKGEKVTGNAIAQQVVTRNTKASKTQRRQERKRVKYEEKSVIQSDKPLQEAGSSKPESLMDRIRDGNINIPGQKEVEIYPPALKNDMLMWFQDHGYDLNRFTKDNFLVMATPKDSETIPVNQYAHNAINAYFSIEENIDLRADLLQITLLKTMSDVMARYTNDSAQKQGAILLPWEDIGFCFAIAGFALDNNLNPKLLDTQDILDFYVKLAVGASDENKQLLEENLKVGYELITHEDTSERQSRRIINDAKRASKRIRQMLGGI